MEKTVDKMLIVENNEKLIANILHDVKSPLYAIKIALQNKLDSELHRDIYETATGVVEYIENFLLNYSFKSGKFNNKIVPCDVKQILNKKIEDFKYIFINKNIRINLYMDDDDYIINNIFAFLSGILNNVISNIAFHAKENTDAQIEIYRKNNCVYVDFRNYFENSEERNSLGLEFCKNLAQNSKTEFKFSKTKNEVRVNIKIPSLN